MSARRFRDSNIFELNNSFVVCESDSRLAGHWSQTTVVCEPKLPIVAGLSQAKLERQLI